MDPAEADEAARRQRSTPLPRWPMVLAAALFLAALWWRPGGAEPWRMLGAVLPAGAAGAASWFAARAGHHATGKTRRIYWATAVGAGCWSASQLLWWWWDHVAGEPLVAGLWTHLGFVAFPLAAAVGLVAVVDNPTRALARTRCGLEALMLTGSSLYIGWSIVPAGPAVAVDGSTQERVFRVICLSMEAWALAMALFAATRVDSRRRTAVSAIGWALAAVGIADGAFTHANLAAPGATPPLAAAWLLGFGLLALTAAQGGRRSHPLSRFSRRTLALTPHLLVALSVVVTGLRYLAGEQLSGFLFWDAAFVLVLLVAHHVSVLMENEGLTADLERRIADRTASLEATERYYRALVQGSSDIVMVLDAGLRARYVSDSVRAVYALPPERLLGRSVAEMLPDDEGIADQMALAASRSEPVRTDIVLTDGFGESRYAEVAITNRLDDPAVRGFVVNIRDVTERARLERQLRYQAFHDGLTGLPNRRYFFERAERCASRSQPEGVVSALLVLDLDGFKGINDNLGHHHGDEVLRIMASRMSRLLREEDLLARLGGDEFAALMVGVDSAEVAMARAEELLAAISAPTTIVGAERVLTASIGVAILEAGRDVGEVVRAADTAMYVAKFGGKSRVVLFEPAMHEPSRRRFELQGQLRTALAEQTVRLHYQPVYDLHTEELEGFEALMRWTDPAGTQVPPAEFVPLAEEAGLIVELGRWALREAIAQLGTWRRLGPASLRRLSMAVNVSPHQLHDPGLVPAIAEALGREGIPADQLVLEITESVLVADDSDVLGQLAGLKRLGVRIAIDDFGTGYASLAYLRRLPVDILKIDRSFLDPVAGGEAPRHRAGEDSGRSAPELVRAIVRIADSLGLMTLAEGVETGAHVAMLRHAGCKLAQGFYYAAPMDADVATTLLAGVDAGASRKTVDGAVSG